MKTRGLPSSNDRRFHNIQEVHKKAQRDSTNQLRAVFFGVQILCRHALCNDA